MFIELLKDIKPIYHLVMVMNLIAGITAIVAAEYILGFVFFNVILCYFVIGTQDSIIRSQTRRLNRYED